MAVQAPFDLGHEVFRQPQVIEGLLESLGGVLRLAAVALEAFSRCDAGAVSLWPVVYDTVWCGS